MTKVDDNNSDYSGSDTDSDTDDYFELDTQTSQYGLRSFYDQYLVKNKINLLPEYQREFVWNNTKQDLLIDSIMRTFVIPGFIFIKEDTNKKFNFECIDGQHRLTVISHFISGEKLNGNCVKWRKKNSEGVVENVLYEKNENTSSLKIRNKRYMTENERDKFNEFNLSICIIKTKLELKHKCTIFNRLQNGERASSIDKLKNRDHPLADLLRKLNIGRLELFKQSVVGKNLWKLFISNSKKKTPLKMTKKNLLADLIMRYAIIYVNGLDSVTSFLNVNLRKDIEINSERANISKKTTEEIIKNMEIFLKHISKIIKKKNLTVHMFYILIDLYNHSFNRMLNDKELQTIVNSDIFNTHNKDIFCKGKAAPASKYREIRDNLLELINKNTIKSDDEQIESDQTESDEDDEDTESDDQQNITVKKSNTHVKNVGKKIPTVTTQKVRDKSPKRRIKDDVSDEDDLADNVIVYNITDKKRSVAENKPVLARVVKKR